MERVGKVKLSPIISMEREETSRKTEFMSRESNLDWRSGVRRYPSVIVDCRTRFISFHSPENHLDYNSSHLEADPDILEDESDVVTTDLYSAGDLDGEGNTDQESRQEKRPAPQERQL